jgi:DNA-binding SARP family transcriptional activator
MTTDFRVLGPVEARLDGVAAAIGPRQQAILALLLVAPNRLVTIDQILDRVWTATRPARPANAVQTQVTLLRRALPGVTITWQTGGYRIVTDEQTIDLHRFRHEVGQARAATDDEDAAAHWQTAIDLWRGEPFAGIDLPWFASVRETLVAEFEAAADDQADTLLRLGRYEQLLPDLTERTARRPLDERIAAQLMQALDGAGRSDDARRHYEKIRDRLADEFGTDPSAPLRELHQRLQGTAPAGTGPVPRQLPPAPGSFTGRADELAAMTKILDDATGSGGTVVISAIAGTGGIGKTWLTLHWAHQHRDRFPDGQLFIDLRGFSPDSQPVAPETAVRVFLDALGVPPIQIPTGLDAQAALLRTVVAGKRMLIVLDNAASAEQVVPLLPGSSTNTVVVNSRDHLAGLVTGHGAHPVLLDILSLREARDLFRRRLGADRLDAEPEAIDHLLAFCGGFPLALSIVIGHALDHPDFPLAAIVAQLRELHLHALDNGEPTTSLPSVLSWSYRALTEEQARAFDLLAVAPGTDISVPAAADLLGRSRTEARRLLRALERASLLSQRRPGRYGMHDLVRSYAREHTVADAEAAIRRITDFYLHSAHAADVTISPLRQPITLPRTAEGVHPIGFDSAAEGMRWLADEHENLSAAQHEAANRGWHEQNWLLAWSLTSYRAHTMRLFEDVAAWRTGLAAVTALGDRSAEALARQHLGNALARVRQDSEADAMLAESIRIAAEIGDVVTQAFSERYALATFDMSGRLVEGEPHARRALALFEKIGNPAWSSIAMINIVWIMTNRGDHENAMPLAEKVLAMQRRHAPDDHTGLGNILDCLGFIANGMGRYRQAIDYYQQARAQYALTTNVLTDLETLEHLGHPHRSLGELAEAREAWEAALRLSQEHRRLDEAQRLTRLLAELSGVAVE